MSKSASVGHKFFGQLFQRRIVIDHHLPEPWEGGVRLVLRHFVGCIEEAQDCFAIVHTREKDHKLYVDCDQVKVQSTQLEVDGDVQRNLAGVNCCEQLGHMILEVQQVNECVIVQRERLYDLTPEKAIHECLIKTSVPCSYLIGCMLLSAFKSTLGNFLTTVLMLDSKLLSDRKEGLDLVSPQAFFML